MPTSVLSTLPRTKPPASKPQVQKEQTKQKIPNNKLFLWTTVKHFDYGITAEGIAWEVAYCIFWKSFSRWLVVFPIKPNHLTRGFEIDNSTRSLKFNSHTWSCCILNLFLRVHIVLCICNILRVISKNMGPIYNLEYPAMNSMRNWIIKRKK